MALTDFLGLRLRSRPKFLGVGWAKTGTTSLGECFRQLGYRHVSRRLDGIDYLAAGKISAISRIARCYDTFEDWPWLLLYKEFDRRFPGMKFILTTRPSAPWLKSYLNQIEQPGHETEIMNRRRAFLYGISFPNPDYDKLIQRYERHNAEVRDYFKDRPQDLLEVDWSQGDGWAQLALFLGHPVPSTPFPHANKGNFVEKP